VSAKPQNSLLAIPLAGYGFWIAYGIARGRRRVLVAGSAVALLLAPIAISLSTPKWIMKHYLYNAVFFELLQNSATPREDLQQLGLNPEFAKYRGTQIFSPGIPVEDPRSKPRSSIELARPGSVCSTCAIPGGWREWLRGPRKARSRNAPLTWGISKSRAVSGRARKARRSSSGAS